MIDLLFDLSVKEIENFLSTLFSRTQEQILSGGAVIAERLEKQAKRDAPWTDRTGMARATLEGINTFDDESGSYCIGVCGNMPYSPDLERGFHLRYAVLVPTMRKNKDNLLDDIRAVISRQEGLS